MVNIELTDQEASDVRALVASEVMSLRLRAGSLPNTDATKGYLKNTRERLQNVLERMPSNNDTEE